MFKEINENIITTLGINTLPIEKQEEMLIRFGEIIYQEVMLRVLDILTEKDKDEFEKLIEADPNPEILLNFLGGKIPNLAEIVKEEAEKLRDESAEVINRVGK